MWQITVSIPSGKLHNERTIIMKRKIRAIIAAALAAAMCAGFAGCGKSEENPLANASGGESKATSKVKIDPNKEQISPFDNLQVTFTGVVPNSKVNISGGNGKVEYTANKTAGVKNGDEIEITAKLAMPSMEETYQLLETSKTYTVSGLSAYAMKLADIPAETMSKMDKQAEDLITANTAGWAEGNKMTSLKKIGYYMLSGKEGFNPSTANYLYCVYKVDVSLEKGYTREDYERDGSNVANNGGEDFYYTYVVYSNIMILEDGTCTVDLSAGRLCDNSTESIYGAMGWFDFSGYGFKGYKDIDSMFNAVVAKNVANYDYENTVKDA